MFEQEVFREIAAENLRINQDVQQLHNDRQVLQLKQGRILEALGATHKVECNFNVTMNKAGTAVNWIERREEAPDGKKTPAGDGGSEPDRGTDSTPEATGVDNGDDAGAGEASNPELVS